MTTVLSTALTEQVRAYAGQVRAHLADLGPEVADELTEGLEADLAEELAERSAADGGPGGVSDDPVPDLARVFGQAGEYAAELRTAAGLPATGSVGIRRRPVRDALRQTAESWREDALRLVEAIRGLPGGRWWLDTIVSLRPAWWLARGWVWFAAVLAVGDRSLWWVDQPYLPQHTGGWLLLGVLVLLSIAWGRGALTRPRAVRFVLGAASVAAAVALLPVAASAWQFGRQAAYAYTHSWAQASVQTIEVPAPAQDGVVVDGIQVSNLFVYDADGNPLQSVQIVDDRGRPVRTITDGSGSDWYLPGVSEPWAFAPATDVFGRDRWNVYPLLGAPTSEWEWDESGIDRVLVPGSELRQPPSPFREAPALSQASAGATGPHVTPDAEATGPDPGAGESDPAG